MDILWVICLMVGAGVLGGFISYLMSKPDAWEWRDAGGNVVIGIGAALLIPLFLQTVSSELLDNVLEPPGVSDGAGGRTGSSTGPTVGATGQSGSDADRIAAPANKASAGRDQLVLFGFCLLAAISSRAFIQTLSDRVLNEARNARRDAQQAVREVQDLENVVDTVVEAEAEPEPSDQAEAETAAAAAAAKPLDPQRLAVLKGLKHDLFLLRTTTGVRNDASKATGSDLEVAEVQGILDDLVKKGLARRTTGKKTGGDRWALTAAGRMALGQMDPKA